MIQESGQAQRLLAKEEESPGRQLWDHGKQDHYTFAVVPKQYITFFEPTEEGCKDHAVRLSKANNVIVNCLYIGPAEAENRGQVQADIVQEILWPTSPDAPKIDALDRKSVV